MRYNIKRKQSCTENIHTSICTHALKCHHEKCLPENLNLEIVNENTLTRKVSNRKIPT
jgi:hypothetical protein